MHSKYADYFLQRVKFFDFLLNKKYFLNFFNKVGIKYPNQRAGTAIGRFVSFRVEKHDSGLYP
ncbi:hypothetical protein EG028_19360 [Chitinophaga barathri]|uniref:Uncharacterized protein n=1 Tax=Chitinophaga barathri TaxID=1647451 RepID=A0A3N4M7M5_9BACT|nr:hypothetical protein EG028_19360 [Chitinophaga barathri]